MNDLSGNPHLQVLIFGPQILKFATQDEDFADDDAREERTRSDALKEGLSTNWRIYIPIVISVLLLIAGIVLRSVKTERTVRLFWIR